jgi:lipoprotein-releasing system permease protein
VASIAKRTSVAKFIGLRYLRGKKHTRFISIVTGFSIAGVALGVATLIVILSVMDGFEHALKKRMAMGEFHVLVTRSAAAEEPYFPFPVERSSQIYAQSPDIVSVNPVLTTEAILRVRKQVAGVSIRGVMEPQMNALAKILIEAQESGVRVMSPEGIWMGKELAYQLNVLPGQKVSLISPTETEGPLESVPRLRNFIVEGIFESGLPEKDLHVIYANISAVREFLKKPDQVNQVEISVKQFDESKAAGDRVRTLLGDDFSVKDWQQLNAHLFASLRLERITMFTILTMIILVASFNVVTSLKMTVIEKRKEIAILQAMGAKPKQIKDVFLIQGFVIGQIGTVIGVVLGLGICFILKTYTFIPLPDIFYDRSLPVVISPLFVAGVAVTALLIVVGAAYFPARSALKLKPLDGIRDL